MTFDSWLSSHPYLEPLANFHAHIDSALQRIPVSDVMLPNWPAYLTDFHAGIPLLKSSNVYIDFSPAENVLTSIVDQLIHSRGKVGEECRLLQSELHRDPDSSERAIAWLLEKGEFESRCPALLGHLGWNALSRHLQPIVSAFRKWRDEDKWLRCYCPTCGCSAAMAQLLEGDQGRRRFLCCDRCNTRWQYRRTGCPFCEATDDHSLRVLAIEGEGGLRIDYCEACRGYLKTYEGNDDNSVLLANWTSIHLDIFARDQNLNGFAHSHYRF